MNLFLDLLVVVALKDGEMSGVLFVWRNIYNV